MKVAELFSQFATSRAKPAYRVIQTPRQKFIDAANEQMSAIESGADKGTWFTKVGDEYVITFRFGKKVIFIVPDQSQWVTRDKGHAVKLFETAIEVAKQGELDSLLTAIAK